MARRVDRLAARRLLAQRRHVHVAEIGEHQRARDRRRRHDQQVDRLALGGERQALAHAEAMLLVDHGEAEIGEGDALLEQGVGADRDVDRRARPAPRACARRSAALSRPVSSAIRRPAFSRQRRHALEVLAREDFGRRHHRRLPPRLDDVGHRQQRDDRLARADVALQQPQSCASAPRDRRGFRRAPALRAASARRAGRPRVAAPIAPSPTMGAAGDRAHPRAHDQQRELVGEQARHRRAASRGARRIDVARARPDGAWRPAPRRSPAASAARQRRRADPFGQARQPLQRAFGRASDGARI